jgi:hypothetical protein
MTIDDLMQQATQLNGVDYDSPKIMIWKKNVYDHVRVNYENDYVKMLDRIFRANAMSRSKAEANSRFQTKIASTLELLEELKNVNPIDSSVRPSSVSADAVKDRIIEWLYKQQREEPERSVGWNKYEVMDDLEDEGFEKSEVALAIDFLDDEGYFKSTSQNKIKYYRLSSKAQSRVLPPSDYTRRSTPDYARVTTNNGIIIMGDNYGSISNVIRNELIELIDELEQLVSQNDNLGQSEKVDVKESSETIKSQLKRKTPDLTIVRSAWSTISSIATMDGFSSAITKIAALISQLN